MHRMRVCSDRYNSSAIQWYSFTNSSRNNISGYNIQQAFSLATRCAGYKNPLDPCMQQSKTHLAALPRHLEKLSGMAEAFGNSFTDNLRTVGPLPELLSFLLPHLKGQPLFLSLHRIQMVQPGISGWQDCVWKRTQRKPRACYKVFLNTAAAL